MQQMWASEGREHRRFPPCAATAAEHLSFGRTVARASQRDRAGRGVAGPGRSGGFLAPALCLLLGIVGSSHAQAQATEPGEIGDVDASPATVAPETEEGQDAEAGEPDDAPALSEADRQARALFLEGRVHHARGEMKEAARAFEAAYRLSARPALCYNLHLVYASLQDTDKAAYYLARYLEQSPEVANRATLTARLQSLRARRAQPDRARPATVSPSTAPSGLQLAATTALVTGAVGTTVFGTFTLLAPKRAQGTGVAQGDFLLATVGCATVGLAGGLLVYLLSGDTEDEADTQLVLGPHVSPTGAGLVARGLF